MEQLRGALRHRRRGRGVGRRGRAQEGPRPPARLARTTGHRGRCSEGGTGRASDPPASCLRLRPHPGFVTGTFGLAAASVVTRLLATAAPLPEGRAAVAAALPPDRSIARPVAQRISERHAYRAAKAAAEP